MRQKAAKILVVLLLMTALSYQPVSAASYQEVTSFAQSYIGVPYRTGGTTPAGFDCSGYTSFVYRNFGIELPRTSSDQYNVGTKVTKADLKTGDLVFFHSTYSKPGITHVGIYLDNNQFISATSSNGIKVDSLSSSYWGPKYYGATRVLTAKPGEFLDVSTSSPTYPAIKTLTASSIVLGYSDGTFHPDENVTRAQAAVIINRVLKKQASTPSGFSDVSDSKWYAADVAAIKEAGIINGFSDGTYRPDANMTRAEMAVILQKAFNLEVQAANTYSDIPQTYWAHDAIVTMASIDSTSVFAGDRYYATDLATRSFFTAAIYNAMNASK
nr:C40 family peptidase [uncultured Bacillus sp.]